MINADKKGQLFIFMLPNTTFFLRGYIPSNIWQGGGLCNHPPYCEKLTIFWLIFTNIQSKFRSNIQSDRFCSKNGWFLMILAKVFKKNSPKIQNFGQSGPKNCIFFSSSPALNLRLKVFTKLHDFSSKNTQFSSFWGGHIPPQTPPCARKRLTNSSPQMSKMDLRPWSRL